MAHARTTVEILNSSLELVAVIKNLYPLNDKGMVLRYSKELSDYGKCIFRVKTNDPVFEQFGDILVPHRYHVRIKRAGVTIWHGAIVDNPIRNHNFQEVLAYEYLYYLDKILVRRGDSIDASGGQPVYRIFDSGTMASNVSTLLTQAAEDFGASHLLTNITAGTITSPNFPAGLVDENGQALSGVWTFSDSVKLQFDFTTTLTVLKQLALYGDCDFRVNSDLTFDFKPFIGNRLFNLVFVYRGVGSNIVDYDVPRYGRRMINQLHGVTSNDKGEYVADFKTDEPSRNTYGLLQGALAFADAKDANNLKIRLNEELQFVKNPESGASNLTLNERGYPLGQYDVGDIVTVRIEDGVIDFEAPRRIVRIVVNVHNTGREMTTVTTNTPKDRDLAAA